MAVSSMIIESCKGRGPWVFGFISVALSTSTGHIGGHYQVKLNLVNCTLFHFCLLNLLFIISVTFSSLSSLTINKSVWKNGRKKN